MEGFVVVSVAGVYLERLPVDGSYSFCSLGPRHATVFPREEAVRLAAEHGGTVRHDPYRRAPEEVESKG